MKIINSIRILIPSLILILFLLPSCYYDNEEELYGIEICDTTNITYGDEIVSILENNCISCHSGSLPSGGIGLSTYDEVKTTVNTGSLLGSIKHESNYSPMPKDREKLTNCEISKIEIWINDGAKND